jgi:hypothetical protein
MLEHLIFHSSQPEARRGEREGKRKRERKREEKKEGERGEENYFPQTQ